MTSSDAAPAEGTVTFIFLTDPQFSRSGDSNNDWPKHASQLNDCLNSIDTATWPSPAAISPDVEPEPIGPIKT
jgi:hypothetical protein